MLLCIRKKRECSNIGKIICVTLNSKINKDSLIKMSKNIAIAKVITCSSSACHAICCRYNIELIIQNALETSDNNSKQVLIKHFEVIFFIKFNFQIK